MSDVPPPPGPPPGWYPDPTSGQGFRWWDGFAWSERTADRIDQSPTGLQPVGEWMSELFRLVINRAGHLFPMVVVLMIPAGLLNGMSVWLGLRDLVITFDSAGDPSFSNEGVGAGTYWLIAASFVVLVVASVQLGVGAARQGIAAVDDRPEPWSASMLASVVRLPRAIGVVLVILLALFAAYLAMVVTGALVPPALLITVPLWLAGSAWLVIRLSLAHVTAALSPAGTSSIVTSWRLTTARFWALFGRSMLLVLISLTLSLVAGIVAAPFRAIAGGETAGLQPGADEIRLIDVLGDNPAIFAIGQLFNALGNGAATVLWAVGFALLYRNLAGPIEGAPEPS